MLFVLGNKNTKPVHIDHYTECLYKKWKMQFLIHLMNIFTFTTPAADIYIKTNKVNVSRY